MAFTPNPNLFNNSFGGGVQTGSRLVDLINQRKDRNVLSQLGEMARGGLNTPEDFNNLGAGLIGLGQVNGGLRAINTPFNREQQALEQNRQQEQRDFQNQLLLGNQNIAKRRLAETTRVNDFNLNPDNSKPETFGKTPVYIHDPETNELKLGLVGDRGSFKELDGIKPAENLRTVDTGFGTRVIGGKSGDQKIDDISKNVGAVAGVKTQATEEAKRTAEFNATAQAEIDSANMLVGLIDTALTHPGLDRAVGRFDNLLPNTLQTQDAVDFRVRLEQLQGNAFMQAYQSLKGAGPITDIEGQKATNAQARLNAAQSEEAMRAAMAEMRQLILERKAKIEAKMQSPRIQRNDAGLGNGFSTTFSNAVTPASGDEVLSPAELEERLRKYD